MWSAQLKPWSLPPHCCVTSGPSLPTAESWWDSTFRSVFRVLLHLGSGEWHRFFDVATSFEEIDVHRPFYPYRPGGARVAHLLERLELQSADQLLRLCERACPDTRAAGALFWTLGAKQVGRAAIAGWQTVLLPALRDARTRLGLWPFDGELLELMSANEVVVCETYPALAYPALGLPPAGRGWSKRKAGDRRAHGATVLAFAQTRGFSLDAPARRQIQEGFAPHERGEDAFDATMGLLFMLNCVSIQCSAMTALAPETLRVEGWILGRDPPDEAAG